MDGILVGQGSTTGARIFAASYREVSLAGPRKFFFWQTGRGKLRNYRQDLELIGPKRDCIRKGDEAHSQFSTDEACSEPRGNSSALNVLFESVGSCTVQRAIYWLINLTHKSDSLRA